jgi:hypothetical protein
MHQCIGAYSQQQMLDWTKGSAEDGYDTLMQKHFYLGCIEGEPVATGMLDLEHRESARSSFFRISCSVVWASVFCAFSKIWRGSLV